MNLIRDLEQMRPAGRHRDSVSRMAAIHRWSAAGLEGERLHDRREPLTPGINLQLGAGFAEVA